MIYREEIRDLFTVPDDYYLAHCISADFGMGAGIVVEFNKRFDLKNKMIDKHGQNYTTYFINSRKGGDCLIEGRVLNLITKERYYEKPSIITMDIALRAMKEISLKENIKKIAMPKIGAGLDRLDWNKVSELIQYRFKDTDIEILVCKLN